MNKFLRGFTKWGIYIGHNVLMFVWKIVKYQNAPRHYYGAIQCRGVMFSTGDHMLISLTCAKPVYWVDKSFPCPVRIKAHSQS